MKEAELGTAQELDEIEEKVDVILNKLKLHMENPDVKENSEDRVKFKLDFIKLSNTVTELQQVVEELKKMSFSDGNVDVSWMK